MNQFIQSTIEAIRNAHLPGQYLEDRKPYTKQRADGNGPQDKAMPVLSGFKEDDIGKRKAVQNNSRRRRKFFERVSAVRYQGRDRSGVHDKGNKDYANRRQHYGGQRR